MTASLVILAGGEGRRLGGNKAQRTLAGKRLIDWVGGALAPSASGVAVCTPASRMVETPYAAIQDTSDLAGPAAGLASALIWGSSLGRDMLVVPCDMPFLPPDLAQRLAGSLTVPRVDGRALWAVSYWPLDAMVPGLEYLKQYEKGAAPPLRDVFDSQGVRRLPCHDAAGFFGINTPQDLAAAQARLTCAS